MATAVHANDGAAHEDLLWSLGVGSTLPEWLKELRRKEREQGLNQGPRGQRDSPSRPGMGPQRAWNGDREQATATPKAEVSQGVAQPSVSAMPARSEQPPQAPPRPAAEPSSGAASASSAARPANPATAQFSEPARVGGAVASGAAAAGSGATPASPAAPSASASSAGPSAEAAERKTNPHDGQIYTLQEFKAKYRGDFAEADIESYWINECRPLQAGAQRVAPESPPAPAEAASASNGAEARGGAAVAREGVRVKKFDLSIKDWLQSMDDSGFLVQYRDGIAAKLDSLEQIVDIYVKSSGEVDPQFFVDVGVKKLGHKRLFEKWFRDNCVS